MPYTVGQIQTKIKQHALKFEDCVEVFTYSACDAGKHPHVHLQDIAVGHQLDAHLAPNYQARPTHSMWTSDDDAINSMLCSMNTKAGEFALNYLATNGPGSRATIHSRSGAYWVGGNMQERHGPGAGAAGPGHYTDSTAAWTVTVLENQLGNLAVVTHYPTAGGGAQQPPAGQDAVEAPRATMTCFYSSSTYTGMAVQAVHWFRGFTQ